MSGIEFNEAIRIYLDSRYSNANVRCLNHAYIVRTVTYCKKNGILILFDKLHYQGLLQW